MASLSYAALKSALLASPNPHVADEARAAPNKDVLLSIADKYQLDLSSLASSPKGVASTSSRTTNTPSSIASPRATTSRSPSHPPSNRYTAPPPPPPRRPTPHGGAVAGSSYAAAPLSTAPVERYGPGTTNGIPPPPPATTGTIDAYGPGTANGVPPPPPPANLSHSGPSKASLTSAALGTTASLAKKIGRATAVAAGKSADVTNRAARRLEITAEIKVLQYRVVRTKESFGIKLYEAMLANNFIEEQALFIATQARVNGLEDEIEARSQRREDLRKPAEVPPPPPQPSVPSSVHTPLPPPPPRQPQQPPPPPPRRPQPSFRVHIRLPPPPPQPPLSSSVHTPRPSAPAPAPPHLIASPRGEPVGAPPPPPPPRPSPPAHAAAAVGPAPIPSRGGVGSGSCNTVWVRAAEGGSWGTAGAHVESMGADAMDAMVPPPRRASGAVQWEPAPSGAPVVSPVSGAGAASEALPVEVVTPCERSGGADEESNGCEVLPADEAHGAEQPAAASCNLVWRRRRDSSGWATGGSNISAHGGTAASSPEKLPSPDERRACEARPPVENSAKEPRVRGPSSAVEASKTASPTRPSPTVPPPPAASTAASVEAPSNATRVRGSSGAGEASKAASPTRPSPTVSPPPVASTAAASVEAPPRATRVRGSSGAGGISQAASIKRQSPTVPPPPAARAAASHGQHKGATPLAGGVKRSLASHAPSAASVTASQPSARRVSTGERTAAAPTPADGDEAVSLLSSFALSSDALEIVRCFDGALAACGIDGRNSVAVLPSLASCVGRRLPRRMQQLLISLRARQMHAQYYTGSVEEETLHCLGWGVVVVGGGPIGLRTSVELALLGCSVAVVEARSSFTRLNVLHLWDWVEADLVELGIKSLDPSAFTAADFKHVSTSQLQHSLLKVALLLGVRFRFQTPLTDLEGLKDLQLVPTIDMLVDATGARCQLFESLGFTQLTVLKSAQALGLVCHLRNGRTRAETQLPESNWSQQFNQERFARLAAAGVNLQNIVYYRSSGAFSSEATHYFVMTAQADSLLQMGALRTALPAADLCRRENVNLEVLGVYARLAIAEFVPQLASLEFVPNQLQIFDFSERKQSNAAARMLDPATLGAAAGAAGAVVTRVGDALQEPFWPEGLGINRGFLHALDCADLARNFAEIRRLAPVPDAAATSALVQRRESLFACVKQIGGHNRMTELKPHLTKKRELAYRIDPTTRYVRLHALTELSSPVSSPRGGAVVSSDI